MAAASSFLSPFPRPTSTSTSTSTSHQPLRSSSISCSFPQRKKLSAPVISFRRSATPSSNPSPATAEEALENKPPQIDLEFFSPKAGADGAYPVDRASAISGEKLLRNIMLDDKIELYAAYGKVMNCGGGGSCGTCIVEIIDGQNLLNERTNTEKRYLKNKPESWRLACQTIVGNKENSGKVVVQRLPQWKK